MAIEVRHIEIPITGEAVNDTEIRHIEIPVEGQAAFGTEIRHASIPVPPLVFDKVELKDNYDGDRPLLTGIGDLQITNAFLIDENPQVAMRYTTPYALTFNDGSLIANESRFEFGVDPFAIKLVCDIAYKNVSARPLFQQESHILIRE